MSDATAGRMLCECPVEFTFRQHAKKIGFIQIFSASEVGHPARIDVFDNRKSANKGKPFKYQIIFTNVKSVVPMQGKPGIAITTQEDDRFTFLICDSINDEWLAYCKLLYVLPDCVIPEVPKRHLVSQQHIDRYNDPSKFDASGIWVVYLINEGVGPKLNFTGIHVVTVNTTNLTFNIYNYYNEKHLLAWEHCNIRRSGCIGPVVFLEIGRKCQAGPGVLWMYYPAHLAAQFRESLHRFLHDNAKKYTVPVQVASISVDASLNSTYQTREQLQLISCTNQELPQDVPPRISPRHQTNSNNSNEVSLANCHEVQDDYNQCGFRQRTAVMPTAVADKYKMMRSKSKNNNNEPTVALPCLDQKTCSTKTTNASSTEDNSSDKPPPLPPKSFRSRKLCTTKGTSTSSVKSVYQQSGEHSESLHLVEERKFVQPSQPPVQQIRTTVSIKNKSKMENAAFRACSTIITEKLDVKSIYPELNSHHLLTQKDQQLLINPMHDDYDKIMYLLHRLPRKADGWFDTFIQSLNRTSANTGHGNIADSLLRKLKEFEDQNANDSAFTSTPIPISPTMTCEGHNEPYAVFVDSSKTVGIMQVRSSETFGSLTDKVRQQFDISPTKPLILQVDDRHHYYPTESSLLRDSKINRYSYITVNVLDTS